MPAPGPGPDSGPDPRAVAALQVSRRCAWWAVLLGFVTVVVVPLCDCAAGTHLEFLRDVARNGGAGLVLVHALAVALGCFLGFREIHVGIAGGEAVLGLDRGWGAAVVGRASSGRRVMHGLWLGLVGSGLGLGGAVLAAPLLLPAAWRSGTSLRTVSEPVPSTLLVGAGIACVLYSASVGLFAEVIRRHRKTLQSGLRPLLVLSPPSRMIGELSEMRGPVASFVRGVAVLDLVVVLAGTLQGFGALAVTMMGRGFMEARAPLRSTADLFPCALFFSAVAAAVLVGVGRRKIHVGFREGGPRISRGLALGAIGGLVGSLPVLPVLGGIGLAFLSDPGAAGARINTLSLLAGMVCFLPFPLALAANGFAWLVYGRAFREDLPSLLTEDGADRESTGSGGA